MKHLYAYRVTPDIFITPHFPQKLRILRLRGSNSQIRDYLPKLAC